MELGMEFGLPTTLTRILQYSRDEAHRLHCEAVEPQHLLLGIIRDSDNSATLALTSSGVNLDELRTRLEALKQGCVVFFENLTETIILNDASKRIFKLAILETRFSHDNSTDAHHLLLAMLRDKDNEAKQVLNGFGVTYESISKILNPTQPNVSNAYGFPAGEDTEEYPQGDDNSGASGTTRVSDASQSDTPIIDQYGIDLTQSARDDKLDPVVGRTKEIERIAQILSRRKKNNPIIIGDPGVGKSAIVEGLAQLIAKNQAAPSLKDKRIVSLNMANIVAGTQYRGQFEERLRRLIMELSTHKEIILFIDEIHTIIGAGSAPGSLDAANILKPALARGEVQCIGATTIDEYRKTIEKDGALERRFQKVMVNATTKEETLQILHNIKDRYEQHHNVTYSDDALDACVRLTDRYISDRSLPDKAIDAMDEAGSRTHLVNVSVPGDIVALEKEISDLREQKMQAAREQQYELAANLRDEAQQKQKELDVRNKEWQESLKSEKLLVDTEDIASVVSMMSGVPVHQMASTENVRLKGMKEALSAKVIAQDEAISQVTRSITRNRIGLKDPNRPIGTFMFIGPTGVGKTYLVQTLAEFMFGSKDALIRIDMSEFHDRYTVSRLVGSTPGYVGYEEGGQLTERVRRKPYSIILFDEIEKAHPDVFNTLLQVMDEGRLTDGSGKTVDFKNTVIIMTSNSGTRQLKDFGSGIGFEKTGLAGNSKNAERIVRKALSKQFAPEFLNRLDDIIMFQPLNEESGRKIALLEIDALRKRMQGIGCELTLTDAAVDFIVKKGFDPLYGARSLKRAIQQYIEDVICEDIMDNSENKTFLMDVSDDDSLKVVKESSLPSESTTE